MLLFPSRLTDWTSLQLLVNIHTLRHHHACHRPYSTFPMSPNTFISSSSSLPQLLLLSQAYRTTPVSWTINSSLTGCICCIRVSLSLTKLVISLADCCGVLSSRSVRCWGGEERLGGGRSVKRDRSVCVQGLNLAWVMNTEREIVLARVIFFAYLCRWLPDTSISLIGRCDIKGITFLI